MNAERNTAQNGPVRVYEMREDMRRYTLDLNNFCGNKEKVMEVAMQIEKEIEAAGLTCEEALTVPAFLYMRMEMETRERLNTQKYRAGITSDT